MTTLFDSHLTHQVYQTNHLNSVVSDLLLNLMIQLKNKKNPALVLSGGGIKAGAFHTGVCLALRQRGFTFAQNSGNSLDITNFVGSSAGSIVATFLASGYSLEEIIHAFTMGAGLKDLIKEYDLSTWVI
jgi:patatin-like phospholipase/acyl hydrolase